jgi:LacI family transcriptional regulator
MSGAGPANSRPRPTIRDVAALAGVGIKTVSRVINDESNVSAATRERVERAVSALNFQPHSGAGALRRGDRKTLTLGLLLESVANPFSAAINRAVEEVASRRQTAVFAASFDNDPEREKSLIKTFTRRRVDGLILTTISTDHGYLQVEREQGTPIVFVDRPPVGLVADSVLTDNFNAAYVATRHLIARGHTRIAHLGDNPTISTAVERRRGFAAAMAEAGLDPDRYAETDDDGSAERGLREVHRLMSLEDAPTAVFTSQNLLTIGGIRALHRLGLQHRIALIGLDDISLGDVLDPPITVMAQDPTAIGTLAAERLFAQLDGDRSAVSARIVPATLIVRGSGEIRPPDSTRHPR